VGSQIYMMQVDIKREKKRDYEEIEMLLKVIFNNDTVADLVTQLRGADSFIPRLARVAKINNQIIGLVVCSNATIVKGRRSIDVLVLAPLAVLPAYQHLGIGGELIRNVFQKARELEFQAVFVIGDEDYFPRFGFEPASNFDVSCNFDISNENFMALELIPGALSNASGKLKLLPLFDHLPSFSL